MNTRITHLTIRVLQSAAALVAVAQFTGCSTMSNPAVAQAFSDGITQASQDLASALAPKSAPVVQQPAYRAATPTYYAPTPAYRAPAPTYHAPTPAYHAPAKAAAPVYVPYKPAYVAPPPVRYVAPVKTTRY